jgi:hypothetical protein
MLSRLRPRHSSEGAIAQDSSCAKFVPLWGLVKQGISGLRRVCECGKRRK